MRKINSLIVAFILILQTIFLTSCYGYKKQKFTSHDFNSFDTVTTIIGYEKSKEDFDKMSDFINSKLQKYHKLYDIYKSYDGITNLRDINRIDKDGHKAVTVSDEIIDLLKYAKEMYTLTNGKTNIAMGSVLSIWHEYREKALENPQEAGLPDAGLLEEASKHTDINSLIIDEENKKVFIEDAKMTLDVGAIAKGFAVEMIADELESNGVSGYILNVGGNVRTVGSRADGSDWIIGIENPDISDHNKQYIETVMLQGESLVSSGNYQRYYIYENKKYHHIIDVETLFPSEKFSMVTVLCKDSAIADALSTALFCMDLKEGISLVEANENIEAMWVLPDFTKQYSSGFKNYIKK